MKFFKRKQKQPTPEEVEKENNRELNWLEKQGVKRIIKQAKRKIGKLIGGMEEQSEHRHKVEEALVELTDIIDIQPFEGEPLTKEHKENGITEETYLDKNTVKYLTNKQLQNIWEETMKTIEREL